MRIVNYELWIMDFFFYLCTRFQATNTGEMVEWSITAVLKTAVLRGTGGSNPSLSAKKRQAFA